MRRAISFIFAICLTLVPSMVQGAANMPFTDLPGWKLTFADEFTTRIPRGQFESASAGRYFCYKLGWRDSSQHGMYDPSIIAVNKKGLLDIWIRTIDGTPRVAAFVPIFPTGLGTQKTNLLGMRVEFRIRADKMTGYKGVPLLWPMSGDWPRDGEINWPEGGFDGGAPMAFMHRQDATTGGDQDYYRAPAGTTWQDWHTYVTEWKPGVSAEFFIDGKSIGKSTNRVPNTAMHLVMQFETALGGAPVPDPSVSGHVQIDRLAVWSMV